VALAQAKRAVYEGAELPLADGLGVESDAFLATMLSDEGVAAMRSYVETPLEERRGRAEPDPA
jgi:enoyl-CoA hydratase/carnithine racemase